MENIFDVKNIKFSYEKGKPDNNLVLDNISVLIEKGKFNCIIGPNGCGKTTFLDLLVKHVKPLTGDINYKGKNLSEYTTRDYAKEVALVSQNFYINFDFSVEEVVMMGRHPYIPRFSQPSEDDYNIVAEVIEKTDITRYRNKNVTQLSGGERQRVVFARALAQDTPVLILDEATSNLDISHTISLFNLIKEKVNKEERTVVAVVQDLNLAAMYSDNLIFFKDGGLVSSGKTDDVLNSENIKKVFNVESKIINDEFSKGRTIIFKR